VSSSRTSETGAESASGAMPADVDVALVGAGPVGCALAPLPGERAAAGGGEARGRLLTWP